MEQATTDFIDDAGSTFARIASIYPNLYEAERRVADLIQKDPEAAKGLSITRISALSGVSQTTVVRFCRALGFEGYSDFKMSLVEDISANRCALPEEHGDVQDEDDLSTLIKKVLRIDAQAIANTVNTLDADELGRAIKAVSQARNTALFGTGASLSVAMDVYYRLLRSGVQCRQSVDNYMQTINARLLEPGDVGIAISYSGETRDTIECVQMARSGGATTICVTNSPRSTLSRLSDIVLLASTVQTRWINDAIAARLAQLAVLDALCVGIARVNGDAVVPVIRRIDEASATKLT